MRQQSWADTLTQHETCSGEWWCMGILGVLGIMGTPGIAGLPAEGVREFKVTGSAVNYHTVSVLTQSTQSTQSTYVRATQFQ